MKRPVSPLQVASHIPEYKIPAGHASVVSTLGPSTALLLRLTPGSALWDHFLRCRGGGTPAECRGIEAGLQRARQVPYLYYRISLRTALFAVYFLFHLDSRLQTASPPLYHSVIHSNPESIMFFLPSPLLE